MKKFRDMTDSEIAELVRFIADGGKVRYRPHLDCVDVVCTQDFIDIHGYYEIPKRPMSIDWDVLKDEFVVAARTRSGTAWAYEKKPEIEGDYWCDAGGDDFNLNGLKSYDPGTVYWQDSLIWKPGFEPK